LGARRAAVVTAAAGAGALALLGAGTVDRFPGGIYRIRLVERLDLYANPDVRPTPSLAASFALILVAGMAATAARITARRDPDPATGRFFVVSALGAAFLGLDDLLGIHESIGLTVSYWFPAGPSPERIGHLVLVVYAVLAGLFLWSHRERLSRSRPAVSLLGLAAASSLVVTAIDVAFRDAPQVITHPLQAVAALALLLGYWCLIEALVIEEAR
jgi:hypothetical protein